MAEDTEPGQDTMVETKNTTDTMAEAQNTNTDTMAEDTEHAHGHD